MRCQGRIKKWYDEKGYGFVTSYNDGSSAFVHIKSFQNRRRRPAEGDLINYEMSADEQNRIQAINIRYSDESTSTVNNSTTAKVQNSNIGLYFTILFISVLLLSCLLDKVSIQILSVYLVLSCITFMFYSFDKSAAINNRWRIKESTLQLLALLGGWPGAMFGQRIFKHKLKKVEFQVFFWIVVFANCGILAWTLTDQGAAFVRIIISELQMGLVI